MNKTACFSGLTALLLGVAGSATDSDTSKDPAATTQTAQPADTNASRAKSEMNNPARTAIATGPKVKNAKPKAEVTAVSFGRGIADGQGLKITFMHNVTRFENGTAEGEFKQSASTEAGTIDIEADVSCATFDSPENKGWIGGTVRRNGSTNPAYAGEAGAEVWFRLLDLGAEKETAFITTTRFKNSKIKTAKDFCDQQPWSDNDLIELSDGALAIFP
ncbi:MAG: hypothetical protein KJO35_05025 [Gammaproteobacteria bacterium]|nr:hypothetical protein [Gammaproteobacteria bacterium]